MFHLKVTRARALAVGAALVLLLGVALWVNSHREAHPPAITQLLTLVYNAPDQAVLDIQARNPDPLEEMKAQDALFQERYGPLISPGLHQVKFFPQSEAYHRLALQYDATLRLKKIQLDHRGEGDYRYTVTLLCTDSQGKETTLDQTGSVQLDEEGLIRAFTPHGGRALREAMSGKPWRLS